MQEKEPYQDGEKRPCRATWAVICFFLGLIPHPVMGSTGDYCRYIKALLTPYLGAVAVGGIDLICFSTYHHRLHHQRNHDCGNKQNSSSI